MEPELSGRVAIVTGGAQGIGRAICASALAHGASVVISDINGPLAEKAANELGERCRFFVGDVSDNRYLQELVEYTVVTFGKIDILVNNAGISSQVDITEIAEDEYWKVHSVNLKSAVFLSKLVMRQMISQRYGRIVNIGSMAGEKGGVFAGIHYSTSKAGMIVLAKSLAQKGGPFGITANAVAPGLIDTAMAEALHFSIGDIPLGRLGTAGEVAEVVTFLASDRASYVSGCTIDINGGLYIR